MNPQRKSTPELLLEAEEAHRETDLIISLGESILQNAREAKQRLAKRIRQAAKENPEMAEISQD